MSNIMKIVDRAPTSVTPYASVEGVRVDRNRKEQSIDRDPSLVHQVDSAQSGQVSNALERFENKIQIEGIKEPAKRQEVSTPLELLSVKVLAEIKRTMDQIAPHEPQEHLISITLKALETNGVQAQVTRVSTSGVATDLDLIGQGPDADHFKINGVAIRNSQAEDDQYSYQANAQSAIAKAMAINDAAQQSGVRAVALPTRTDTQKTLNEELGGRVYGSVRPVRGFRPKDEAQLIINGIDVQLGIFADRDQTGELLRAINTAFAETGVQGMIDPEGELVLEAPDGRNISVHYAGTKAKQLARAIGLRPSGAHPYGGRIAMVSFREVVLDLGRDVNYALGDIAGDFSVMDETYYSH